MDLRRQASLCAHRWHAAASLARERERACDDEVLRMGARPSDYAALLLDLARRPGPWLPATALAMARRSAIEGRLLLILGHGVRTPRRSSRWLVTATAADTALVLSAIHGPDGHDDTVPDVAFQWDGSREVKGLRLGYIEREFAGPTESASADERTQWLARKPLFEAALDVYRQAGATLVPVAMPDLPAAAIYAILNAEAGAMFDELVRSGAINDLADKGPNGRANQLRASRFIPAVEYIRAQRVRTLLLRQMNALFEKVDAFLAPSSSDSVTICNLTGHPAIVVPAGLPDGLPIGLMVTAPLWKEDRAIRVAAAFEAQAPWSARHPAIYSE